MPCSLTPTTRSIARWPVHKGAEPLPLFFGRGLQPPVLTPVLSCRSAQGGGAPAFVFWGGSSPRFLRQCSVVDRQGICAERAGSFVILERKVELVCFNKCMGY